MVQGTWYGVRDTHNFRGAPVAQPAPTKFSTKVVIVTYSPNRSYVPNLKLLASTVAEINRGSQFFLDAPLARTPANFGRKSCFLASPSPSTSCIPNLKLLSSTVAEIYSLLSLSTVLSRYARVYQWACRVPASVAAKLAGVRADSSIFYYLDGPE